MNQEIQRIKQKDYSKLDDQLFQNMNKVDNIHSSLDNLTFLQQFLITQINHIQKNKSNQTSQNHQNLRKNCELLKQSILKLSLLNQKQQTNSKVQEETNSKIQENSNITQHKRSLHYNIHSTVYQININNSRTIRSTDTKETISDETLLKDIENWKEKYSILAHQYNIISDWNKKLKKNNQEWELAKQRRKEKINYLHSPVQLTQNNTNSIKNKQFFSGNYMSLDTLNKQNYEKYLVNKSKVSNFTVYNSKTQLQQKINVLNQNNIYQNNQSEKSVLQKYCSKEINQRLSPKQPIEIKNSNTKSMSKERRNSKQKLKVFSMFS